MNKILRKDKHTRYKKLHIHHRANSPSATASTTIDNNPHFGLRTLPERDLQPSTYNTVYTIRQMTRKFDGKIWKNTEKKFNVFALLEKALDVLENVGVNDKCGLVFCVGWNGVRGVPLVGWCCILGLCVRWHLLVFV